SFPRLSYSGDHRFGHAAVYPFPASPMATLGSFVGLRVGTLLRGVFRASVLMDPLGATWIRDIRGHSDASDDNLGGWHGSVPGSCFPGRRFGSLCRFGGARDRSV